MSNDVQSQPLIETADIVEALKGALSSYQCGSVEIFDEFPSDMEKARQGVYVSDVDTVNRTPYQLAINIGGNIYTMEDEFEIILVTYQGDDTKRATMTAIQDLVLNNTLMDGYHERNYTSTSEYKNRAEYITFTFTLKRIQCQ